MCECACGYVFLKGKESRIFKEVVTRAPVVKNEQMAILDDGLAFKNNLRILRKITHHG